MAFLKKLFSKKSEEEEEYIVDEKSEDEDDEEIDSTEEELVLDKPEDESDEGDWDEQEEGQLALDVYQDKDNIVIRSTIAGVQPDDLDISVASDMVTIKGERRQEQEVKEEDYFYQECYWGSFSRSLPLPVEVDVDKVSAEIKDGVLTLTLPKASSARTKKVRVKGTV